MYLKLYGKNIWACFNDIITKKTFNVRQVWTKGVLSLYTSTALGLNNLLKEWTIFSCSNIMIEKIHGVLFQRFACSVKNARDKQLNLSVWIPPLGGGKIKVVETIPFCILWSWNWKKYNVHKCKQKSRLKMHYYLQWP